MAKKEALSVTESKKKRRAKKQKTIQKTIDDNIKTLEYMPKGFINSQQFAEKAGVVPSTITQHRQNGLFSLNNLRYVKLEGRKRQLCIHWDSEGPTFIKSRPYEKWPDWYKESEEVKALQLETSSNEITQQANTAGSGRRSATSNIAVIDLNSAKVREKQLSIHAKELELQKAQNEVIELHEVADVLQEVATELRQALLAIGPRIAPLVAAENTPHKCLAIIEDEITAELTTLSKFDDFVEGK